MKRVMCLISLSGVGKSTSGNFKVWKGLPARVHRPLASAIALVLPASRASARKGATVRIGYAGALFGGLRTMGPAKGGEVRWQRSCS